MKLTVLQTFTKVLSFFLREAVLFGVTTHHPNSLYMSLHNKYIKDETHEHTPRSTAASTDAETPRNVLKTTENTLRWYPMRIFHSSIKRQSQLNSLLSDEETIAQTYIPQHLVNTDENTYIPALVNYIFLRTTLRHLRQLKSDKAKYDHLRYVMNIRRDQNYNPISTIAHVPDKQMQDFIRVIDSNNEHVIMLENLGFACKPGEKVRITNGMFAGVEGTLKSIKKHLAVVIPIKNILAVAITNVPRKYLEKITPVT